MPQNDAPADTPFAIRGALEGFYGTFYTVPQRQDLLRFLGQYGFNLYLYGPKNDRYHRRLWREPYPAAQMQQFAATVNVAGEAGVDFGYALSPGETISYGSGADFAHLIAKLRAFYDIGVRTFSLFLDDIAPQFHDSADAERYPSYAAAQADLCNRTLAWLQERDDGCRLSMCPTDYHGSPPFGDYLHELGERLAPAIDVFYTGPKICSPQIRQADADAFARALQRPPLIWDNYPVNDLAMQPEMHIGPLRGRDGALHQSVRGLLANLLLQPEASKIPLLTLAAYFRDPHDYDAQRAWNEALRHVGGEESVGPLRLFAENSLSGCLRTPQAEKLERLAQAALQAVREGADADSDRALQALQQYLLQLDQACYHLNVFMSNLALRHDLLPWTEGLQLQQELGRQALSVWRACAQDRLRTRPLQRLQELLADAAAHPKSIGSATLLQLGQEVLQQAEKRT